MKNVASKSPNRRTGKAIIVALAALICLSGCSVRISDADVECVKGHDEVVDGPWLAGKETKFVCDEYKPKDPPG